MSLTMTVEAQVSDDLVYSVVRSVSKRAETEEIEPNVFFISRISNEMEALRIRAALAHSLTNLRYTTR